MFVESLDVNLTNFFVVTLPHRTVVCATEIIILKCYKETLPTWLNSFYCRCRIFYIMSMVDADCRIHNFNIVGRVERAQKRGVSLGRRARTCSVVVLLETPPDRKRTRPSPVAGPTVMAGASCDGGAHSAGRRDQQCCRRRKERYNVGDIFRHIISYQSKM